jgi:hypothetical protein
MDLKKSVELNGREQTSPSTIDITGYFGLALSRKAFQFYRLALGLKLCELEF